MQQAHGTTTFCSVASAMSSSQNAAVFCFEFDDQLHGTVKGLSRCLQKT